MRIWSIHPKYLDTKGLVALWRETLLAKNVLLGNTNGYKNHPQLYRFKASLNPIGKIDCYLSFVYKESQERGYNFNKSKINWGFDIEKITVTSGQMEYERIHLLKKLKKRDTDRCEMLHRETLDPHPMFEIIEGEIEDWEVVL